MKEKQKWLLLNAGGGWQIVMPDTDIKPHSTDTHPTRKELSNVDCPCKPKINFLEKIIIHNSFEDTEKVDKSLETIFKQL